MRLGISLLSIGVISVILYSCNEVGPNINLGKNSQSLEDTTYLESPIQTPEEKRVLLEEFTGVQCVNCPAGHVIIQTLKNDYGSRLVPVAFHTDFLGQPYTFSTEDFRTSQAEDLQNYLVFDGYKPSAAIDRVAFNGGQTSLLYPRNTWKSRVEQQLNTTTPVNIKLTPVYDAATKKLTLAVELHYTSEVTEPQKLTLILTESEMLQPQLNTGNVIDTFYNHKDVERIFLTNTRGDEIATTTEAGRVVRKVYQTTLNQDWNADNMHAVAFVHQYTSNKVVLQAAETELK